MYETKNESSRTKFELIVRIIVQIKIDEFVDSVQETEQHVRKVVPSVLKSFRFFELESEQKKEHFVQKFVRNAKLVVRRFRTNKKTIL